MEAKECNIKIEKTARYFINRTFFTNITKVLIVIHGYAQLGKDFINEFSFMDNDTTLIIAPEGLSKFYFKNKIGASWMTKENRVNEIIDYVNYLEKVMNEIRSKFNISNSEIYLLGFSQGVHTAVRWFTESKYIFKNLLLCSSDFPKDADFSRLKMKLVNSSLYFIYGNKDEVISGNTFKESMKLLVENNVSFKEVIFEGGHNIDIDSVIKIINKTEQ